MEETIEFEGNESGQALVAQLDLVFTEIQEKEDIIALAKSKGDQAKEKAQGVSTNFFKRKQAVEDLKDAQISNAEATVGALEAIEQVSLHIRILLEQRSTFLFSFCIFDVALFLSFFLLGDLGFLDIRNLIRSK